MLFDPIGFGGDVHAWQNHPRTARLQSALAFDFDQTDSARSHRSQAVVVAQNGNVDSISLCNVEHGLVGHGRARSAVDFNGEGFNFVLFLVGTVHGKKCSGWSVQCSVFGAQCSVFRFVEPLSSGFGASHRLLVKPTSVSCAVPLIDPTILKLSREMFHR